MSNAKIMGDIMKLLTVAIPREHLGQASTSMSSWRKYEGKLVALVEQQRRAYDLMDQGLRGNFVREESGHFFDEGFLNMSFFAEYFIRDISYLLKMF